MPAGQSHPAHAAAALCMRALTPTEPIYKGDGSASLGLDLHRSFPWPAPAVRRAGSAGKHRKPEVSAGTAADLSKRRKKPLRALHHYKQPPNRLTPTK